MLSSLRKCHSSLADHRTVSCTVTISLVVLVCPLVLQDLVCLLEAQTVLPWVLEQALDFAADHTRTLLAPDLLLVAFLRS